MVIEQLSRLKQSFFRISELKQIPGDVLALAQSGIDFDELASQMNFPFDNAHLLYGIAKLVRRIGPNIDSYDVVISDEVSGRLLSLLLTRLINGRHHAENTSGINTYFLVKNEYDESKQYVLPVNLKKGLLVTEVVGTGRSIRILGNMLSNSNIELDIACLSFDNIYGRSFPDSKLYYVDKNQTGNLLHSSLIPTGVMKSSSESLFHPVLSTRHKREDVINARHDIVKLAEEFAVLLPPLPSVKA